MKALKAFKGKGQICVVFFAGPVWMPWEDSTAVHKKWAGGFHCLADNVANYPKPKWFVPSAKNLEILEDEVKEAAEECPAEAIVVE